MKIVNSSRNDLVRVMPTLAQIAVGQPFRHPCGEDLYLRVSENSVPGGWLGRQSSKELPALNLNNGTIYYYAASKHVVPVKAEVTHYGDL